MSIKDKLRDRIGQFLWEGDWLEQHARHEDPKIRLWAFDRLTYCYPEAAVQVARERISDEDVFLRQTATSHLGSHGEASDCDLLKEQYEEASPAWKGTILNALAERGDEDLLDYGEALLSDDSVNINLVLSFIEAVKTLDTDRAESTAWDVYEKTRTEAVFSSLTGYFLERANPADLAELSELVLEKLSDNVMLKVRHFCSQVRDALYLFSPTVALPRIVQETDSTSDTLLRFCQSMNLDVPDVAEEPEVQEAVERYRDGDVIGGLDQLAEWGQDRLSDLSEKDSLRHRELASLLSGFANPPENIDEIEVPGRPLVRLFQLALNSVMHYEKTPHPLEELEAAQEDDAFPQELYERESPFLVDRIALLGSKRTEDKEQILSDAASDDRFFRRVKALKILALKDDPDVIPELIRALNSSNKLLYRTGARALVRFGPDAVPEIDRALDEGRLDDGLVTAADVLRRIPTEASAEVFLSHFDRFLAASGVDPIASFAADLAVPETAEKLRSCLDRNLLMVGEQLGIVCELFDLEFPEEERIQEEMEQRSAQNQGGPQTGGSPFPGGGGPPMPGMSPEGSEGPPMPS